MKRLSDLIGIIFNKDTYSELVYRIENDVPLDTLEPVANTPQAQRHREKILFEETMNQFEGDLRPIIEPIANAVDAKSKTVDVYSNSKSIIVKDKGKGMSIDDVLQKLVVFFNSDKEEEDIGMFGVGFFSLLGYCLQDKSNSLEVETTKNEVKYKINFQAKTNKTKDLYVDFEKTKGKKDGTTVKINVNHKKSELKEYITKYLNFFDSTRSAIRFKGDKVNNINEDYRYTVDFNGQTQEGRIKLDLSPKKKEGEVSLYSQGVFVMQKSFPLYNLKLDIPKKIKLVEGRDEFKMDGNYTQNIQSLTKFLIDNRKKIIVEKGIDTRDVLMDIVNTAGLGVYDVREIINDNIDKLFEERTYLVRGSDALYRSEEIKGFFGNEIGNNLFVPANKNAEYMWLDILPGIQDLIFEKFDVEENEDVINNLKLPEFTKRVDITFLKPKKEVFTRSGILYHHNRLFINTQHPIIKARDFVSKYQAIATIAENSFSAEYAEDFLI